MRRVPEHAPMRLCERRRSEGGLRCGAAEGVGDRRSITAVGRARARRLSSPHTPSPLQAQSSAQEDVLAACQLTPSPSQLPGVAIGVAETAARRDRLRELKAALRKRAGKARQDEAAAEHAVQVDGGAADQGRHDAATLGPLLLHGVEQQWVVRPVDEPSRDVLHLLRREPVAPGIEELSRSLRLVCSCVFLPKGHGNGAVRRLIPSETFTSSREVSVRAPASHRRSRSRAL